MNMKDKTDAMLVIISVLSTFLLQCYMLIFPTQSHVI